MIHFEGPRSSTDTAEAGLEHAQELAQRADEAERAGMPVLAAFYRSMLEAFLKLLGSRQPED